MPRVQWTPAEQIKVCQEYFNLRDKHQLPSRSEDGWRKAQENVLPPQRWRPFTSSPSASPMNHLLNKLVGEGKVKRQDVKAIHPPPPAKPTVLIDGLPVSKETYDLVVKHHRMVSPQPVTLDDFLRNMMTEQIDKAVPAIMEKIGEKLADHQTNIEKSLAANYTKFMKFLDPNYKEPEEQQQIPAFIPGTAIAQPVGRKPVVVLVNANAEQTQSIQSEFPQYDVRAVQDRTPGEQDPLLVVGFTKFMNKTTDLACERKYGAAYLKVGHKGATASAKVKMHHHLRHSI